MADDLQALLSQYQQSYNQARQANESRYSQILQGYDDRYSRGMANLEGLGQTEALDINRRYTQMGASEQQGLVGRGLGNTTVANSVARGVESDRTRQLGALNERVRAQRLGLDAGLSQDKLAFMERRTDAYPDANLLAQLASQYGASQAANRALTAAQQGGTLGQMGRPTGGPDARTGAFPMTPMPNNDLFARIGAGNPITAQGSNLPGGSWSGASGLDSNPYAAASLAGSLGGAGALAGLGGIGGGLFGALGGIGGYLGNMALMPNPYAAPGTAGYDAYLNQNYGGPTGGSTAGDNTLGGSVASNQWGGQTQSTLYGNPDWGFNTDTNTWYSV